MGTITNLRDSIETVIGTELGASYSVLSNVTELEKNSFKGANTRFGVLSGLSDEVDGTLRHVQMNQVFQGVLTDGYFSSVTASDLDKRNKTLALQDLVLNLFAVLKAGKAGLPSVVIAVQSLSVEDPEFLEDDHVVAIRFNFTVKHRIQI